MRHNHLRPLVWRNEPVARDWNAIDLRRIIAQALLPALKVDRAAERREHYKLGEGDAGTKREFLSGLERIRTVCRQSENEGSENMDPVFLKLLQPLHKLLAR